MDPLQLFADAHVAHLEVDVEPSEPEGLALPESHRQCDRIESLKTVASDGFKQPACLVRREGLDRIAFHSWPID